VASTPAEAIRRAVPLLEQRPLAVVTDFDGTVARLSQDPWGAHIIPAARRALRVLAGTAGVEVAFLSGRGVDDLSGRARVGGASYLGDHGAEAGVLARRFRLPGDAHAREPAGDEVLAATVRLAREVPREVTDAWLVVEHKLQAVCFHFRTAPDPEDARRRVAAACDRLEPRGVLVRAHGRRSIELRPPGALSKGPAMALLLAERSPAAAIALGDDPNDVPAFRALREYGARTAAGTLSVAVTSHPEWLPTIGPEADVVLADAAAAAAFLAGLARAVRAGTP
jgi:trehalose 6-phosphate phosphatase